MLEGPQWVTGLHSMMAIVANILRGHPGPAALDSSGQPQRGGYGRSNLLCACLKRRGTDLVGL